VRDLSVGLRAVFKNHALNHTADLYTPHAWLGIAVVTLYCTNVRPHTPCPMAFSHPHAPCSTFMPLQFLTLTVCACLSLCVVLQYVVGVCVFALPYASLSLRQGVLPYHVGMGLFGYVASVLTAASGVVEKLAFKGHCQATPGVSYADIAEVTTRHS
jgi:hypothetical protein